MKVGSLFSGIGGIDLGFQWAGMEIVWAVENDKAAAEKYRLRFPDVQLYEQDIRSIDTGELSAIDVLAGGFPCQDVSVAGRRKGLAGERSGLFYEFMRIVDELSPSWVLIENVPGLLSSNKGRDMATVVGTLGELGYGHTYRVLDSQYFGVPQKRRRVYIVGHLGGYCPPEVLFEPESCERDIETSQEEGTKAAHTLTCSANSSRRDDHTESTYIVHALTARHDSSEDGSGRGTPLVVAALSAGSSTNSNPPGRRREDDTNLVVSIAQNQRGELRTSDIMPALACGGGKPGRGYPAVAIANSLTTKEFADRDYSESNYVVCPSADSDGVREASGVPRRMDSPDAPRYRALGNAVTVPVASWIGRRIIETEQAKLEELGWNE